MAPPTLVFGKPLPSLKEGDRGLASSILVYFFLWGPIPYVHPMYAGVGYEIKGTKVKKDKESLSGTCFVVPGSLGSGTETLMKTYKSDHRAS